MNGNSGKVHAGQPVIISIQQIRHAWLRYQGTVYAVCTCPPEQFRAWVGQIAPPTWKDTDARAVLTQNPLDDLARWFVLCTIEKRLVTAGQSLPLWQDEECTIAFRSKSERAKPVLVQKVVTTSSKPAMHRRREKDVHTSH